MLITMSDMGSGGPVAGPACGMRVYGPRGLSVLTTALGTFVNTREMGLQVLGPKAPSAEGDRLCSHVSPAGNSPASDGLPPASGQWPLLKTAFIPRNYHQCCEVVTWCCCSCAGGALHVTVCSAQSLLCGVCRCTNLAQTALPIQKAACRPSCRKMW